VAASANQSAVLDRCPTAKRTPDPRAGRVGTVIIIDVILDVRIGDKQLIEG
jgi:hypothetical protein